MNATVRQPESKQVDEVSLPAPASMPAATPILKTEALSRKYNEVVALDNLNLTIHRGEIFGYIGPNGAGKTTTFRILSGLLDPTSGRAWVDGQDVTSDKLRLKQVIGYLPDNFGVYPSLRVWEYLDFFAAAYRIPRKVRPERIDTCLRIAHAIEFRDKLMGALSRGSKQRVGIAKTLLHDPAVLILDEPAATIDPRARVEMRQLLRELAAMGKAVLVSSHILPELADVCDTVGFLSHGRLLARGPVQDVLRSVRQSRLIEVKVLGDSSAARDVLREAPGEWSAVEAADAGGAAVRFEVTADEQQLAEALALLLRRGVRVVQFAEIPADLEDLFMHITASAAATDAATPR